MIFTVTPVIVLYAPLPKEFGWFCVVCLSDVLLNSLSRRLRSFKGVFSFHSKRSLNVELVHIRNANEITSLTGVA